MVDKMKNKSIFAFCALGFLLLSITQSALATNSTATTTNHISKTGPIVPKTTNVSSTSKNTCPCIVFRLDDVEAYYLHNVQMKILDEFQKKNASLSIGVIGYDLHNDKTLVSYLKQTIKKGNPRIEVANHGWKHENFADLNQVQQVMLLNNTNQELQKTISQKPIVFITPYNLFNNYTLKALKQVKMQVISSGVSGDMYSYVTAKGKVVPNKDSLGLYHMPSMTDFQIDIGTETLWTKIPKNKVIDSINSHIKALGYDVVLLHPQNFAKIKNGTYVDSPDNTELDELGSIIDYANSKHIRITTLSDIVGLGKNIPVMIKPVNASLLQPVQISHTLTKPHVDLYKTSMVSPSPTKIVNYTNPTGDLIISMKYPGGNRIEYSSVSLKIYHDNNKVPFRDIASITGNPYDVSLLPLYHQYKVEVYLGGMLSSTDYVILDSSGQELDMTIADGGSMRVTAYYNDGQTPLRQANVDILSQDNKTRGSSITDIDGQTGHFYLPSTNLDENYYQVKIRIDDNLSYSYTPVYVQPDNSQELKIVTPWPSIMEDLVTVKVYNQSKILTATSGPYVIDLFDEKGNKMTRSTINVHGEAYFWNMKIGSYTFRAIDLTNGLELGRSNVIVDGTKTNFVINMNQNKYSTIESISKQKT